MADAGAASHRPVGAVTRPAVLQALADELDWGLAHGPAPYALLNACRALVYLSEGRLVAKLTGAAWALDRGIGPSAGIRGAIAAQVLGQPAAELTAADVDFIQRTALRLRQSPPV